jgi:hypothetical protein
LRGVVWVGSAVIAALLVAAAAIGLYEAAPERTWRLPEAQSREAPQAAKPALPPVAAANPPAAPQAPAAPVAKPPSFDIVSVDPRGQAVIAGRAAPGDRVRVLDGDKPIGEVTADGRGEWVLVPDAPIAPGNRQLGLAATGRDGGPERRSPDVVALSVGPPAAGGADTRSSSAVLLPRDANTPARILQRPGAPGEAPALALEAAEYGGTDQLLLSGQADPGARLNVYAANRLLGTTTADSAGKWTLAAPYRQPAGAVELRLDQLAADGTVAHRAAAPFSLPTGTAIRDGDTYVVQRGNSLWRIARQVYGQGVRYTTIYEANRSQITDPERIYPGQQFKVPKS